MTPNVTIRLFTKSLENLEKCMDKATESAKARSFDVDVLAKARLAPDQFDFIQQVQTACDQAKYAAAYLGWKYRALPSRHREDVRRAARADPEVHGLPRHRTGEGLFPRRGSQAWRRRGSAVAGSRGSDYLVHVAVPNFFFHATMAYAILRHNGV